MPVTQTRRRFLGNAVLVGVAGLLPPLGARAAEPGLETTTVRLGKASAICTMPQMIPQQLLEAEGFTDIRFVDETPKTTEQLARGEIDLMVNYEQNRRIARGLSATVSGML